jgi:outer membrane protein OmpA-like peptidoglycan-associated protein
MAVAGLLTGLLLGGSAYAQSLEDQINNALKSKAPAQTGGSLTRGLGGARPAAPDPAAAEQHQFINKLRTRSIAIEPTAPSPNAPPPAVVVAPAERAKIAEIVKDKPKIDLEIFFDYASWQVGPKALPALLALGKVLSSGEFKGTVFFINGYTDARGSAEYNQVLSQRRADSVRRLLVEQFHLAPDTLIAVGFGEEQLKIPEQPNADQNRRVQIVNTEMKAAAGK